MLFYLLSFLLPTTTTNSVLEGLEQQSALEWVEEQQASIQSQAAVYGLSSQELLPIIFPELLRYAEWKDLLETEALGMAYVEGGSQWADFSIGPFQMKPSFVETLEQVLLQWPKGQAFFGHLLANPKHSLAQQRQTRLDRLQQLEGQVDYLCCFYAWMQQKVGFQLVASTPTQQIALLATAYNSGFQKDWPALAAAQQQHFFPYGARYPQEGQENYATVALAYYQQLPLAQPSWRALHWPFWKP